MSTAFAADGPLPLTSLALEASAGTGKTWTLTSLTIRYVAELGIELPDLLLVTFTRAATAELRDRVRRRLAEALRTIEDRLARGSAWSSTGDVVLDHLVLGAAGAPDPDAELRLRAARLQQATAQLDEATISTIHGFCQAMLRHAALEAGVEFDAVLLEDDADLLGELVDDHLARELRPADPVWIRYLQGAAKLDRDRLAALAREVAGLPTLQLSPPREHPEQDDLTPWRDALAGFTAVWEAGGRERALALFGELKEAGAFTPPKQRTYTDRAAAERVGRVDAWLATPQPIPPVLAKPKPAELHHAANPAVFSFTSRAIGTKLVDGWPIGDEPLVAAADRLLSAVHAPATRFLHRAATSFWTELDLRKRQRTVLTFDDLLRRLATALEDDATRDAVLAAIRQRYRVALIDEFQDTDPVQWRIFSALFASTDPFVLIGDPKQAIYGFRGADVHTYVHARDSRPSQATLVTNHRSDTSFVAACNHLFGQPGAFATPDIPYHPIDARHGDRLHDPSGRAALQIRLLTRDAGQLARRGSPPQLTKGWADRALPQDVAAVTVELLCGGVEVESRPLAPRDVAVLVRTNRRALAVQRALQQAGVPAVIQRGGSVFETAEAEALERLLVAMLRPSAQRPAVAAAATSLFGRDAATLVTQLEALDSHRAPTGADAAASALPGEVVSGEGHGWDAWVDALTRWGQRWQRDGVLVAVQSALLDEQVATRLLRWEDGDRRLTNLRHLLELLHAEEVASGAAGHALVDWLAARRAEAAEGSQAAAATELRLEVDAEAVRVVTIHGSKGLQYPVVLCPDLWDGKRKGDDVLVRFHDPDVAELDRAITLDLDVDADSPRRLRNLGLARWEVRTEQLRLAYVALTRAQHRAVVWWGPLGDSQDSALASLLHGHAATGVDPGADPAGYLDAVAARVRAAEDDQFLAEVTALVDRAEGCLGVEVVRAIEVAPRWEAPEESSPELAARPATRRLDRSWRRTSFSGLVRGATGPPPSDGGSGRDVDSDTEAVDAAQDGGAATPRSGQEEVPLARFPRGPGPGTFLHDVLEHLDLVSADDDEVLVPVLERMEARHGIDPQHREVVMHGLRRALATSLGPAVDGVRLADLSRAQRLDELRFELPVAGGHGPVRGRVHLGAIADLLADADDPLLVAGGAGLRDPALAGGFRGYLNGSIDLFARLEDGRFFVADYKSNWLGDRTADRSVAADYRPQRLVEAMLGHHYVLQGLLYLVAAHRYLRWRAPGYDPDRDLVGAGYLFLRGMVGGRGDTGVVWLRPGGALIESLSRLLERGAA